MDCSLTWAYSAPVNPRYRDVTSYQRDFLSARRFLRGEAVYTIGRETFRCGPGEWIFTPEGVLHQRLSADAVHESIRFRLHWPTGRPLFRHERLIRVPEGEAREFTRRSTRLCAHLKRSVTDPPQAFRILVSDVAEHLEIEADFRRWTVAYVALMRAAGVSENRLEALSPRLSQALSYIQANGRRGKVEVQGIARHCGVSVSRFNRLFVEQFGEAPSGFIARRRLEYVMQAILAEGMALKTAAYEFGFGSPQNFSRWFRTQTGRSPQRWLRETIGGS